MHHLSESIQMAGCKRRGVQRARDQRRESTYEELKTWYEKSGLPLKKFFNTSGMLYKELGLKDKLLEMSEEEQLKLLSTDGMLVKRPLVVGEKTVLTGFSEKAWTEQLLGEKTS